MKLVPGIRYSEMDIPNTTFDDLTGYVLNIQGKSIFLCVQMTAYIHCYLVVIYKLPEL